MSVNVNKIVVSGKVNHNEYCFKIYWLPKRLNC